MILSRRCRPLLAAAALLTALGLGGCGYSPERTLSASTSAQQTAADNAKAAPKAKANAKSRTRSGKAEGTTSRRQIAASISERECLVRAMYFESQRSSRDGLMAVGTVVMNRVNSPSYPSTICGVVGQNRQFAPGVLSRSMSPRERKHADTAADEVLAGKRHDGIGDAMFFHVASRRYKYPNMRYLKVAGGNIFYTKVGRNAPRVVEGSALAYANTANVANQVVAAAPASADDTNATTAIKTAMAPTAPISNQPETTAKPKAQEAANDPTVSAAIVTAAVPAQSTPATRVSFTAPVDEALSRAQSFSTKPLSLSAYRTIKSASSSR
ncbi:cell wall hydrolase [Pseudochelatococcus sp. G4_1912]|uniref:cell wall hydrolase n=1 Tax=Pseudochelatococcus sp. G4_1912 TaxID=3114288 RepID=UPI0039C6C5AC